MLRGRIAALLTAFASGLAALSSPAAAVQSGAPAPEERSVYYRCSTRIPDLGGVGGSLSIEKTIAEDGSVAGMSVVLEDRPAPFVRLRQPSDRASATLRWPGDHRFPTQPEPPFSWSRGTIDVNYSSSNVDRYRPLRREIWRQVVVDRDASTLVYEYDGMRTLMLSGFNMHLMSDLAPMPTRGSLHMSLDDFIAWGTGAERLTVYETMVQRRSYDRQGYANGLARRMRIVAEYDVDVAALVQRVAQVRAATSAWEAGLADFRTACERVEDEAGEIIVT